LRVNAGIVLRSRHSSSNHNKETRANRANRVRLMRLHPNHRAKLRSASPSLKATALSNKKDPRLRVAVLLFPSRHWPNKPPIQVNHAYSHRSIPQSSSMFKSFPSSCHPTRRLLEPLNTMLSSRSTKMAISTCLSSRLGLPRAEESFSSRYKNGRMLGKKYPRRCSP